MNTAELFEKVAMEGAEAIYGASTEEAKANKTDYFREHGISLEELLRTVSEIYPDSTPLFGTFMAGLELGFRLREELFYSGSALGAGDSQ